MRRRGLLGIHIHQFGRQLGRLGGTNALVDLQRLPKLGHGSRGVTLVEGASTDSFEGMCLLQRAVHRAGELQGTLVVGQRLLQIPGFSVQCPAVVEGES